MQSPKLIWDAATAYDFFISLQVLHKPRPFGLRGSWAAGVRSRLPLEERELLEQASKVVPWPIAWVHTLPGKKDSATALQVLTEMPAAERLYALCRAMYEHVHPGWGQMARELTARGSWNDKDREALKALFKETGEDELKPTEKNVTPLLEWWSHAEEYGERYLKALQAYREVFFAEEERRIAPALEHAIEHAQKLAEKLPLPELIDKLTQGLRLAEMPSEPELVFAPSYWTTPLASMQRVNENRMLLLFGARPADVSLVPGEVVPETMVRALKALSDPTRLRILRYLIAEPLSPARLARRLRLRAPTVIHHLDTLRLARLVHVTVGDEFDKRLSYTARTEAVETTFEVLKRFLEQSEPESEADEAQES